MTGRAGTAKGIALGLKNFVKGRESEGGEGARFTLIRGWWISQVGLVGTFLALFFVTFFNIDFLSIFLRFWRGLGGQNASQNRFLERFLDCFFGIFILMRFWLDFCCFFEGRNLKNHCFS